jgi:type II secretory pathway pseudopilin PulG
MEINPYEGTLHGGQPQPALPKPSQFRPTLLGCLAVIGILGFLIALLLPARRSVREPARRAQCSNNLMQIGLALQSYSDKYGALPPAHTVDAEGKPLHSWRTLLLPFLEQENLYKRIDLSKPWDDPVNKAAFETGSPTYGCPSTLLPLPHTTYMAIVVPGGCFQQSQPRKLSEITDDHHLTLMVIEVDEKQAVLWMSPTDCVDLDFLKPGSEDKLAHWKGVHAVSVDGRVHFLSKDLKPEVVRALVTIDGKDDDLARQAD